MTYRSLPDDIQTPPERKGIGRECFICGIELEVGDEAVTMMSWEHGRIHMHLDCHSDYAQYIAGEG